MTRTADGRPPPVGALEFLSKMADLLATLDVTPEGAPCRGICASDAEIAEQLNISADDWPAAAEWLLRQGLVLRYATSSSVQFYEPGPALRRLIEAARQSRRGGRRSSDGAAS